MSNTHVATAKFRQEGVHDWQSEEGLTDATNIAAALDAQTEATLALAYEQRTANLIALVAIAGQEGWASRPEGVKIRVEALERLDIDHKLGAKS